MQKKTAMIFGTVLLVTCLSATAFAMTRGDTDTQTVHSDDVSITVSEKLNDGQIQMHTYCLEDLACTVVDMDGNVVYSGSVIDPKTKGFTLKAEQVNVGDTVYWFPIDNENGFKSGDGIAVDVSVKTDTAVRKRIGLTDGDSSTTTSKVFSDIMYTGTDGYWKLYVKNESSSAFKVTGGRLSWGE